MLATANISFETLNTTDFARGNLALADRPQKTSRRSRKAPAAGQVCLVVSPDPLRHMMFGQAAERSGWRQAVASDQTTALAHLASGKVGLVLIDTATTGEHSMAERHLLIELLSGQKDLLTVVCGRTDDSQEEIWARQCGAWMYLPGVAPESDLDPILSGARELTERRQRQSATAWAGEISADF